MKRTLVSKLFFICALFVFVAMSAEASVVSPFNVKLVGVGDSQIRYGAYSGLYNLEIDGSVISAMCDDKLTNVFIDEQWKANRFSYSQIQTGALVKFASFGVEKYSQAGYLFSLLGGVSISNQSDINLAIWDIMSPGSTTLTSIAQVFYDTAISGVYDRFNFDGIMDVITPDPLNSSQEYLVSSVPVPAAIWLFGTGLIGIASIARRRKTK